MRKSDIKRHAGKLCSVEWIDANCEIKAEIKDINSRTPESLLAVSKTYGKIWAVDDIATIIVTEESETEMDWTVVPNSIITEIKRLK